MLGDGTGRLLYFGGWGIEVWEMCRLTPAALSGQSENAEMEKVTYTRDIMLHCFGVHHRSKILAQEACI
jgi:hypothetical protein